MLSRRISAWLDREIVGQSRAVTTLTQSAVLSLSGMASPRAMAGAFLLVGPGGTGKTHAARVMARLLAGEGRQPLVADCKLMGGALEMMPLAAQLAAHFTATSGRDEGWLDLPPRSVILIEHLECAKPEVANALLGALEVGHIGLPDGHRGRLAGALVLITTNLCAREIYGDDRQEIGFSAGPAELEESEKSRIYGLCAAAVEKTWGPAMLGHLDDLVVFHRLRARHYPLILKRLVAGLNASLAEKRLHVQIDAAAAEHLIERSGRFPQHGAWFLEKVFRRFVVYPVADLVTSMGRPERAVRIRARLDSEGRLCFQLEETGAEPDAVERSSIPVDWIDESRPVVS